MRINLVGKLYVPGSTSPQIPCCDQEKAVNNVLTENKRLRCYFHFKSCEALKNIMTYNFSGLVKIFLNLMVTRLFWNTIMPLCFLVCSLNEVPGTQLASNELGQQKTNQQVPYCKAVLCQIPVEVIVKIHHNLKWAAIHCFSALCGVVWLLFECEQ